MRASGLEGRTKAEAASTSRGEVRLPVFVRARPYGIRGGRLIRRVATAPIAPSLNRTSGKVIEFPQFLSAPLSNTPYRFYATRKKCM